MNTLAAIIGYIVIGLVASMCIFALLYRVVCAATQAWCLTLGAWHLKMYRANWSRPRMFLWTFWNYFRSMDYGTHECNHQDGRFLMRWTTWRDWNYAGRRRPPLEAPEEQR